MINGPRLVCWGLLANGQTPVDVYHQPGGDMDSCDQGRVSLSHRRYSEHSQGKIFTNKCVFEASVGSSFLNLGRYFISRELLCLFSPGGRGSPMVADRLEMDRRGMGALSSAQQ